MKVRVSRDEVIRQLRARGEAVLESMAQALAEQLPLEVDAGAQFLLTHPLVVEALMRDPALHVRDGRIVCEGVGCAGCLEFQGEIADDVLADELQRRGWELTGDLLLCPRCKPQRKVS